MKVSFKTLGCRLNEAELQTWATKVSHHGWSLAEPSSADVIVINTCAVTAEGARKSRQQIRRMHRDNTEAKLVVTGCYASLEPTEVENMLGVDLVVDNADKDTLAEQLLDRFDDSDDMPMMATEPGNYAMLNRSRERAFLKIQDGCRYRCTYCIVTVARGDERSQTIDDLVKQVNDIYAQGIHEIVLTGVHVGGYGTDLGTSLYELVEALLEQTEIPRIRFASVEPWDLPDHFFELFANSRLMPHMHLPLQSGADSVLRRMSRRCRQDSFRSIIERARGSHPDFNITTDIIVGFPGETDEEWQESLKYIEEIGFSHVHCFSYSDREGTKAARLPNKVSSEIKKHRMAELQEVAQRMRKAHLELQKGIQPVLWESAKQQLDDGLWVYNGYTPNFTRVQTKSDKDLSGQVIDTKIEWLADDLSCVIGSINEQLIANLRTPIVIKAL